MDTETQTESMEELKRCFLSEVQTTHPANYKNSRRKRKSKITYKSKQKKSPKYNLLRHSSSISHPTCEEKTSTDSLESQIHHVYMTSTNLQGKEQVAGYAERFRNRIKGLIQKFRVKPTGCGIIVTLYCEEDVQRLLKADLAKIQGVPVQATRFSNSSACYRKFLVVKNVPWFITVNEIREALKIQRICPGRMIRTRGGIRIEIFNSCEVERLLIEGVNFYNCATYAATLETQNCDGHYEDIVQCYRCQGFWHTSGYCRNPPRCVRCGENHEVEFCQRDRNNPVCCHCGGAHHAAYKFCPVRMRLAKAAQMGFTLSKDKCHPYDFK